MAIFESLSTGCIEFEDYIVNGTVEDLKKYIETEKKLGGTSIKYYFAFNHAVEKAMDVSEEKFELICDSLHETEEGDVYDVIFNDIQIRFRGSLLCLAAAKGNIPAIKYLLKKGYDVNNNEEFGSMNVYVAGKEDEVSEFLNNYPFRKQELSMKASPLACALLCGQASAVKVLAAEEGVYGIENFNIGYALLRALKHGKAQRAAAEALCPGISKNLEKYKINILAASLFLSADSFVKYAKAVKYNHEEMKTLLEIFLLGTVTDTQRANICKIIKQCKELIDREYLLNWILQYTAFSRTGGDFFEVWYSLAGDRFDLSHVADAISFSHYSGFKKFIESGRRAGIKFFIDADAVRSDTNYYQLYTLIRNVEIKRKNPRASSISGFMIAVLNSGNMRLMRVAADSGLIKDEPADVMIKYLNLPGQNPSLRAFVMLSDQTHAADEKEQIPPYMINRWGKYSDYNIEDIFNSNLDEEECLSAIKDMFGTDRRVVGGNGLILGRFLLAEAQYVSLAKNTNAVKALLKAVPSALNEPVYHEQFFGYAGSGQKDQFGKGYIHADVLGAAVCAGNSEVVRTILESGEVHDIDKNLYLQHEAGASYIGISPIMAAIYNGYEEIAQVLLEHGAKFGKFSLNEKYLISIMDEKAEGVLEKIMEEASARKI